MYITRTNVEGKLVHTINRNFIQTKHITRTNIDGQFIQTIDRQFFQIVYIKSTNIDGQFIQYMYTLSDVTSTNIELSTMQFNTAQ